MISSRLTANEIARLKDGTFRCSTCSQNTCDSSEKISAKTRSECEVLPLYLHEKQVTVAIAGDRRARSKLAGSPQNGAAELQPVLPGSLDQLEVAIKGNAVMEVASLTKRLPSSRRLRQERVPGNQSDRYRPSPGTDHQRGRDGYRPRQHDANPRR